MHVGPKIWWWGYLWKLNVHLKLKITLWLVLNNKLLTWENGVKCGWIVPSRCSLCKNDVEFVFDICISCPYAV